METGVPLHLRRHSLRLRVVYKSKPPTPQFQSFRDDVVISMRDLPFSRISARRLLTHRFRDPKALCIRVPDLMSDESSKNQPRGSMDKKGEAQSERPPPPPLPEKPLPGDCCGSGCVRCVWDVYYEELEAYNEYYSNESKPKS